MFILKPILPTEMSWTTGGLLFAVAFISLLFIFAYLDYDEDEDEMKEGFADYKPEEAMSEAEAEETPEAAPEEVKPRKFFTRWQTADVILNRDPHTIFQTFDYAPIMPPELETAFKYNYVSIQTLDGRKITWDKDGSVIVDDEVKKMILMEIGVADPQCEHIEALTLKDEWLSDHQVDLFAALVRWSFGFEHEQKIQYVPLYLSRLNLEGILQDPMGNYEHPFGNDEKHENRVKIF
jgi:hypothetical protein